LSIINDASFALATLNNTLDPKMCSIAFRGSEQENDDWVLSTYFFRTKSSDSTSDFPIPPTVDVVRTSNRPTVTSSPFGFELKSKKKARPGFYTIEIEFTYFNGLEWKSDLKTAQFKVLTVFERCLTLTRWAWKYLVNIFSLSPSKKSFDRASALQ